MNFSGTSSSPSFLPLPSPPPQLGTGGSCIINVYSINLRVDSSTGTKVIGFLGLKKKTMAMRFIELLRTDVTLLMWWVLQN
jgi:hypothetical protein